MTRLPPDFKEFLECLNHELVEYLVVGGYAVNVHGHSRATADMDVWLAHNRLNFEAVCRALSRFGLGNGIAPDVFEGTAWVFQIGVEPLRIDLLTKVSGLQFASAYQQRHVVCLDGVDVPFLSLADLRINKRAANRNKDLGDLDSLPDE